MKTIITFRIELDGDYHNDPEAGMYLAKHRLLDCSPKGLVEDRNSNVYSVIKFKAENKEENRILTGREYIRRELGCSYRSGS